MKISGSLALFLGGRAEDCRTQGDPKSFCPALLLPAQPGPCSSLFSPERHKCSIPSSGRRREEKGSVVFLSLFLSLTADHQAADQVRKPEWKSASAGQAPPPSGSLSLTDFSLSRWGEKERERKNEKEKPQTSFENQRL